MPLIEGHWQPLCFTFEVILRENKPFYFQKKASFLEILMLVN